MTTPIIVYLLPFDVIIEILLRLPVNSLLRFQSISKQWQSMITSSYFVNQHFHIQSAQHLVCRSGRLKLDAFSSISLFPNETTPPLRLDTSLPGPVHDFRGPCNGIICVQFQTKNFALWNPATRKLWPIPNTHGFFINNFNSLFSFWVDVLTNQFKFFLFIMDKTKIYGKCRLRFITYSSLDGYWTETPLPFPDDGVSYLQCSSYSVTNGFYYFLKLKISELITTSQALIAYDIALDIFQEIHMPESKLTSPDTSITMSLYGDSLALFVFAPDNREIWPIQIWVMKERGYWNKLLNVKIPAFSESVGFWKENELYISRYKGHGSETIELIIYDLLSGKTRKLEVEKPEGSSDEIMNSLCYKESLLSLNAKGTTQYARDDFEEVWGTVELRDKS